MGIMRPHMQPDGGMIEIDTGLLDALHNGYAPLGWEGDRSLYLAWNRADQRMELWKKCDDMVPRMIMRGKPGMRVADMKIIQFLVQHDSQRGHDAATEIIRHNNAIRKDAADVQRDKMGEAAERLYHGIQKDIGAGLTGSTRDFMPLPEAPWKKNKKD